MTLLFPHQDKVVYLSTHIIKSCRVIIQNMMCIRTGYVLIRFCSLHKFQQCLQCEDSRLVGGTYIHPQVQEVFDNADHSTGGCCM